MKHTVAFVILTSLLISACSTSTSDSHTPSATLPAGRCLRDRDCQSGESCEHPDNHYPCGACIEDPSLDECNIDNPCSEGQMCVRISPPCYCGYNICVESCDLSGCPAGQVCSDNGTCQALDCKKHADCNGTYCIEDKCSQEPGYCSDHEPRS